MGEMCTKTEVMCACEWKTRDCAKASTDQASGPLHTRKSTWEIHRVAGWAQRVAAWIPRVAASAT